MKKLIALVALVLFAVPAMATIVGTKHDLTSGAGGVSTTGTTEVCVFCHTPHNSNTAVTGAPLWNRTTYSTAMTAYTSTTFNAVADGLSASDAPLCLSCHDGSTVSGALTNPPNNTTIVFSGALDANANITSNLTNDHPVGFDYASSDAGDAEIVAAASVTQYLFGGEVWCSSCHDVHNNSFSPFLRVNNAASGLCLTCHIK